MRVHALAVAVAAAVLLVPAAPASAELVAYVPDRGANAGAVVLYESRPGADRVTVRATRREARIQVLRDRIVAGPGCVAFGLRRARCRYRRHEVRADLGASRDEIRMGARLRLVARGGPGADRLNGGGRDDHLDGGPGRDRLSGGFGDDLLLGGEGDDHLRGFEGHDRLFGGVGDDRLDGWLGNDLLNPGQGLDRVHAGSGRDRIRLRDTPPVYDRLDCGRDRDRVISRDRADHRGRGCERG